MDWTRSVFKRPYNLPILSQQREYIQSSKSRQDQFLKIAQVVSYFERKLLTRKDFFSNNQTSGLHVYQRNYQSIYFRKATHSYRWSYYYCQLSDKIKCSHILVKKQSEAIAIIDRLKKGESFANLARELSTDKGSGKRGGELGLFGRGVMVKNFEDAAFKLKKGEISEPVKTEFGYHIIKRAGS